jgi:AcrR family transcriptional regulator
MAMRNNQGCTPRPRGRPQVRSDEETKRLAIEAASKAFQTRGYAGTNMNIVSQQAGISTKTMYRLIPTKAALFQMVIAKRIGQFILAVDEETLNTLSPPEALERILIAYAALALDEETIALNRAVIAEHERFPEIASDFYQGAIERTGAVIENWLKQQCDRGLIRLTDTRMASGMLRGMMIMDPMRAAMLGQRSAPDRAENEIRAKFCAALFLQGCQVKGPTLCPFADRDDVLASSPSERARE